MDKILVFIAVILASSAYSKEELKFINKISSIESEVSVLSGKWQVNWGRFLDPKDDDVKPDFVAVDIENMVLKPSKGHDGRKNTGFATFRYYFKGLPANYEGYSIRVFNRGAMKVALRALKENSQMIVKKLGEPVESVDDYIHARGFVSLPLSSSGEGQIWMLQVSLSNYNSANRSFVYPTIGLEKDMVASDRIKMAMEVSEFSIIGLVAIFNILIFLYASNYRVSAYLGLTCVLVCLRVFATSNYTGLAIPFSSIISDGIVKLEYLTVILPTLSAAYYLSEVFPAQVNRSSLKIITWGTLLAAFSIVVLPSYTFTGMLGFYQSVVLMNILVFFLPTLFQAIRMKADHSLVVVASFSLIIMASVFDVLSSQNNWNFPFTTPLAVASFLSFQGVIVAREFRSIFLKSREQNQILSRMLDLIKEKEEARTSFFNNASHELRTPINGILGYLQGVLRRNLVQDKDRNSLIKALTLTNSFKDQVNNILDIAKMKRGNLKLELSQFDAFKIAEQIQHLGEGLAAKSNSKFIFESEIKEDSIFFGDMLKIKTIARNLLGNAFKFKSSAEEHEVLCSVRLNKNEFILSVEDNGIGIEPSDLGRIFDDFTQVSADARRSYEGTGLGLSQVKDLLVLLKGRYEIKSIVKRGTTIVVYVPSLKDHESLHPSSVIKVDESDVDVLDRELRELDLASKELEGDEDQNVDPLIEGVRLMVIDDNKDNRDVIADNLSAEGFDVRDAHSGELGLQMMKSWIPEIVLLDMMMPEMSGEDVIKVMKEDRLLKDIPVILVTARASDSDKLFGLGIGADDYLAKPVAFDELIFRVRNILERKRLTKESASREETAKWSLLGRSLQDVSHEIKNVLNFEAGSHGPLFNADEFVLDLPIENSQWRNFLASLKKLDFVSDWKVDFDLLESLFRDDIPDKIQRSLALMISSVNISSEGKQAIWEEICGSDRDTFLHIYKCLLGLSALYRYENQSRSIKDIVYTLMDLGRDHEMAREDLGDILNRCKILLQGKLKEFDVDFTYDKSLTQGVLCIKSELIMILANLIGNGVDAVKGLNKEDRWVKVSLVRETGNMRILVENGGPLIDSELQESIFERNFTTKGGDGSGLGLYLARKFALRNQGDIELDPYRQYTCFAVTFPLEEKQAA